MSGSSDRPKLHRPAGRSVSMQPAVRRTAPTTAARRRKTPIVSDGPTALILNFLKEQIVTYTTSLTLRPRYVLLTRYGVDLIGTSENGRIPRTPVNKSILSDG
jgi:hypothetical protein